MLFDVVAALMSEALCGSYFAILLGWDVGVVGRLLFQVEGFGIAPMIDEAILAIFELNLRFCRAPH